MTHEEYLEQTRRYVERIESKLDSLLPTGSPEIPLLQLESMRYSLMAGGKRLRPVLTLAACDMLGASDGAEALACALEMIHTASLIHDDLPGMDNDTLRRGKPTNHVVYGEGQAILAGDGLLFHAYECVLKEASAASPETSYRMTRALYKLASAAGCSGMTAGQCCDLAAERGAYDTVNGEPLDREDMLKYIHMRKTGRMLIAPFEIACEMAAADAATESRLLDFARPFGLLFQVVDDYLDAVGDAAKLGKSIGKDADSGKLTYVSLYGLEGTRRVMAELTAQAEQALTKLPDNGYLAQTLEYMAKRDY